MGPDPTIPLPKSHSTWVPGGGLVTKCRVKGSVRSGYHMKPQVTGLGNTWIVWQELQMSTPVSESYRLTQGVYVPESV